MFIRCKWQLVLVFAILLGATIGCGGPRAKIVGKWQALDSSAMIWEFSSNGSVLMGSTKGRYTFGDQRRIKIETGFTTAVYQMEFSGDRMILRSQSGSKLELTRIK
jgi:hypothetical protein